MRNNRDTQRVTLMLHEIKVLNSVDDTEFNRPLIQRGICQCIVNIAESAKRLSSETRSAMNVPWQNIIHARNVAVTRYLAVDMDIIREIFHKDIPLLESALYSFNASQNVIEPDISRDN